MTPGDRVYIAAHLGEHDGDDRNRALRDALVRVLAVVADFGEEPEPDGGLVVAAIEEALEPLAD